MDLIFWAACFSEADEDTEYANVTVVSLSKCETSYVVINICDTSWYLIQTQTPVLFLQANRVDEEMREDRQSRSPPVEVSTVYTYTKYAKQNGDETTDDYSFVTAATFPNRVSNKLWQDFSFEFKQ